MYAGFHTGLFDQQLGLWPDVAADIRGHTSREVGPPPAPYTDHVVRQWITIAPRGTRTTLERMHFTVSILRREQARFNRGPLIQMRYLGTLGWQSASGDVIPVEMPGPREQHLFGPGWVFQP
jgi:hypothetical protein